MVPVDVLKLWVATLLIRIAQSWFRLETMSGVVRSLP